MYEFQNLQYTHYQYVLVTLDVDKIICEVATECKWTRTLSEYFENILKSEKSSQSDHDLQKLMIN